MRKPKKSYLELFLDNSEQSTKKKKEKYFDEPEEKAILRYNDPNTPQREKSLLFEQYIESAFKQTVTGVLKMPRFRRLPKSMDRDQLIEETYFRLIEKISKFLPNMIGKNGQPVKAYSYFSTIAKNYILEKKLRHEKVLKNKADVESSIDLSILSEDTLKMMSNYDKMDVQLDDYETTFNGTRDVVRNAIQELINNEEKKPEKKQDQDFLKVGYTLMYLLEKWNSIEFMKKNEFMRILTLYTSLKQQQVSFQFKKFKTAVFKKIKPFDSPKKDTKVKVEVEEDDVDLDPMTIEEDIILLTDFDEEVVIEEVVEELPDRFKYGANSLEEFEIFSILESNDQFKARRKKNI